MRPKKRHVVEEVQTTFHESFAMPNEGNNDKNSEKIRAVYDQLCKSYHAIDDFRAKLLGLLPTGTGIFLLVPELFKAGILKAGEDSQPDFIRTLSLPLGIFGFAIALGLFSYELY